MDVKMTETSRVRGFPDWDAAHEAALDAWRDAGRSLVADHHAELQQLIEPLQPLIRRGRYSDAAAAAQVAANYAALWHPGLFASRALEGAIRRIGEAAIPVAAGCASRRDGPLRVLHILSHVRKIGGHARMAWRWICNDSANVHSVALTRQSMQMPDLLTAAVARSGGQVHCTNRRMGGLLGWAKRLQRLICEADLVVLHINNEDIIPLLALSSIKRPPPVLLVNFMDHMFWLGVDFADLIVNTRRSGHRLCAARRGISPERNALLPLCLERVPRQRSRQEAKLSLGLPETAIVILTVARALKFRTFAGISFADPFVPLMLEIPDLHLVALGPGGTADWSNAETAVPGRVHMHPERPDTKIFLEAADIYVDSFPFVSITSLMEAGLHELPLVTRDGFGPNASVMAADSLGLDDVLLRVESIPDLHRVVRHLAADQDLRGEIGRRTRFEIESANTEDTWSRALSHVYERALSLPRRERPRTSADEAPAFEDLDLFSPFVFGEAEYETEAMRKAFATERALKVAPTGFALRHLVRLALRRELVLLPIRTSWKYIVPEWLSLVLRSPNSRGI